MHACAWLGVLLRWLKARGELAIRRYSSRIPEGPKQNLVGSRTSAVLMKSCVARGNGSDCTVRSRHCVAQSDAYSTVTVLARFRG